jgi:uncharacterized membrane protein
MSFPPEFSRRPSALPLLGCLTLAAALFLICLLPVFLVDAMRSALVRLDLHPAVAMLAVIGIFVGSLVNIPVHRIPRTQDQPDLVIGAFGVGWFSPQYRRVRHETVIALNVGGCVIPALLAVKQLGTILGTNSETIFAMLVITAANVFVCYRAARPTPGVGVMMPGLLSPLVAVGLTWLFGVAQDHRAPVAFVAGVSGPLIGADLLHLRHISQMSIGTLSIGGAGTFDGIVLSGILAALLA